MVRFEVFVTPAFGRECEEIAMPIGGWVEDSVSRLKRVVRGGIVVRIQNLLSTFLLDQTVHRFGEFTLVMQVALDCDLSAQSLHVGRQSVGALVQVLHETDQGPSDQADHQPGEQQGILECIESLGDVLCGQSNAVGDLLERLECFLEVIDIELCQFV